MLYQDYYSILTTPEENALAGRGEQFFKYQLHSLDFLEGQRAPQIPRDIQNEHPFAQVLMRRFTHPIGKFDAWYVADIAISDEIHRQELLRAAITDLNIFLLDQRALGLYEAPQGDSVLKPDLSTTFRKQSWSQIARASWGYWLYNDQRLEKRQGTIFEAMSYFI